MSEEAAYSDAPDDLLAEFAVTTPGIVHGLVVAADGLRLATTPELDDVLADQLSAALSGLLSLARATATLVDSHPVQQVILEMWGGYLFGTAIGEEALLAIHARRDADLGVVGYEMTLLASRLGNRLLPDPRVPTRR